MLKLKKGYEINVKIRYVETDRMGFVHHSNYPVYFEQARVDWLEELGFSYKRLEDEGVIMPVVSLKVDYKKPSLFGDNLKIKMSLTEKTSVKFLFSYKVFNQHEELICTAEILIVTVDLETKRIKKAPQEFLDIFN